MLIDNKNIKVYYHAMPEGNSLKFDFKGKFDLTTCQDTVSAWNSAFESFKGKKFTLIWDCSQMSGFDVEAQREWVKHMNRLAGQIEKVIVIADNIVIRGAARLILKLFSFESEVYNSITTMRSKMATLTT